MKKLWEIIKSNLEITGYVILALLFLCACFLPQFIVVAGLYVFLFAFLLRNEIKILGLIIFIYCFYFFFNFGEITYRNLSNLTFSLTFFYIILVALKTFVFVLYLSRVLRKEKKLNLKLLIPLILFFVYMLLPLHQCNLSDLISVTSSYLVLYVVFEERHEINLLYLVRVFGFGIILSFVLSLYHKISPFLISHLGFFEVSNHIRHRGLTFHPLQLAAFSALFLSVLLILKYKQKINLFEFLSFFIPVLVFGYLTISRAFVVCVIVALFIFAIFYIVQNRVKALPLLFMLCSIFISVIFVFWEETSVFFSRFTTDFNFDSYIPGDGSDDVMNDVFEGEISALLNREDLLKFYWKDWSSSAQVIFFGRGISRPEIGGLNAHNIIMQKLWEHGLIGCLFYIVLFVCVINWKQIKNIKAYLCGLIFCLPFAIFLMVELIDYEFIGMVFLFVLFGWLYCLSRKDEIDRQNLPTDGKLTDAKKLKKIKLSFIIPVYNGEKYIKRCLDKVLRIDLKKEVIVINDGSQDQTLRLLEEYAEKITLINLDANYGVSHARNLGLERATGDYVAFIDVDDDFEVDMHIKLLNKMLRDNAEIGICRFDHVMPNGQIIKVEKLLDFDNPPQSEVIKKYLLNRFIHAVWTSVYQAELAKSIKFEEQIKLGEDRLYQLKALLKAKKTCFVNEVLYHYVKNDSSATHIVATPQNVLGHVQIHDYLTETEKELLESEFSKEYRFFQLSSRVFSMNMLSRWLKFNRSRKSEVKEFINKYVDKNTCKEMLHNQNFSKMIKLEIFFLKIFGVGFHLAFYPFYEIARKIIAPFKSVGRA